MNRKSPKRGGSRASSVNPANHSGRSRPGGQRPSPATKPLKLRILGGHMRGRTVMYHGEAFTRPMKDNIRENLFNIIGSAIKGAIAFDLFSGTGAVAFESISRGASSAVLVEQNRIAVRRIEQTIEELDIGARTQVLTADTFRVAPSLLAAPDQDTPWIVFLCPPYALWTEQHDALCQIIRAGLVNAPPGSVIVTETDKGFDHEAMLPPGPWDFRTYGRVTLGFIEPANRCGVVW